MSSTSTGHDRDKAPAATITRKVLVSLGIGTVAYLITNLLAGESTAEPQLIGITLSVFIGGVTLVTQVLIDFERRLVGLADSHQRHNEYMEHLVSDRFSNMSEINDLFGRVEASALPTDAVLQLLRNATKLGSAAPDLTFRLAQEEFGRMSEFLKELSEGSSVTYDGEDRDWMLALARNVQTSIDATSLSTVDAGGSGSVDSGLWASDLGQRYLDTQRHAIKRGVRVRRVFIIDGPQLATDPGFRTVCSQQQQIGIEVRILDASGVQGTNRSSLFDFVLFDNVISYEVTPTSYVESSARSTIVNTRLELRASRVDDRVQRFADLWSSATPFEPLEPQPHQPTRVPGPRTADEDQPTKM